ncbi:DUF932 domain-containing protein [Nitrosospira sp. Nsp1]|uniref:DUF932 domain-containing protein n=1 Tax=Nitrosospira sp. Nsp1 TaxID=136547 RepID=UPI00088BCE44|nr:protein of unknown function [Nitrosospira sp. Nsp1]
MQLSSRFASRSPVLRSDSPLSDDQIRAVVPSIYAEAPHQSRSERYSYIPTAAVLTELRKEGFQPFMVTQTRVRNEDRCDHTKHMIRLRHANQVNDSIANEIILLNSHDGTSSYQMPTGAFRFVCANGLVCGDTVADVRIPHKGDVTGQVAGAPDWSLLGIEHLEHLPGIRWKLHNLSQLQRTNVKKFTEQADALFAKLASTVSGAVEPSSVVMD